MLLALAEFAELLDFAILLVELLVFAILVELLAFAANCDLACIRNRGSLCQIRFCEFVSVCIPFFKVFLCELILFDGTKGGFFSLFSFAMSFNLAL